MPATAKVTFIFNLSRWGWTETFYWLGANSGLDGAKQAAGQLLSLRMACMSKSVVCDGFRVTDLASPFSTLSSVSTNLNAGPTNLGDQEPWAALLVRLLAIGGSSGIQYQREYLMRGLPFSWNGWNSTAPTQPNLQPIGVAPVNNFLSALSTASSIPAGNWCLLPNNRQPSANPSTPLGTVGLQQPGSYFTFVGDGSTTFTVGEQVVIGKAKGFGIKGLLGPAYITAQAAGGGYVTSRRQCGPVVQTIILTKPGVVRKVSKILIPITSTNIERWVKRDTGRSFTVTRGRQRSRCC